MKLVVALALLSNAAAFMAPVQPRAAAQPLKAITTEVRSNVRKRRLQIPALSRRRAFLDATHVPHRP